MEPVIIANMIRVAGDIVVEAAREEAELEHTIHSTSTMVEEVIKTYSLLSNNLHIDT